MEIYSPSLDHEPCQEINRILDIIYYLYLCNMANIEWAFSERLRHRESKQGREGGKEENMLNNQNSTFIFPSPEVTGVCMSFSKYFCKIG